MPAHRPGRFRLPLQAAACILLLGLPRAGRADSAVAAMPEYGEVETAPVTERFDRSPLLDEPRYSFRTIELGYALPAGNTAPGWDDLGIVEINIRGLLLYWESMRGTDLDLSGAWDNMILHNFDGTSSSYTLTMARISLQWSQRFVQGYGLRASVSPGVYAALSELSSDGFALPFSIVGIKDLGPRSSVYAGVDVYPGFDHVVDPRIGLFVGNGDAFRLNLGYPETLLSVAPTSDFRLTASASWRAWPEYSMDDDPRKTLRYTEGRYAGGLHVTLSPITELNMEVGRAFNREISFDSAAPDVDLDDALFIKLGLSSLF